MAVAFDAASFQQGDNVSSLSWTHTPSGTPTGVGVGAYGWSNLDITAATYGGASFTQEATALDSNNDRVYLLSRANPASGAQTVALTFSSGFYAVAGAVTVTGGSTTDVFSATSATNGASTTPSITISSSTDELGFSVVGQDPSTGFTENGSPNTQTARWIGTSGGIDCYGSTQPGASSITMGYTAGSADPWAIAAGSFRTPGGAACTVLVVGGGGGACAYRAGGGGGGGVVYDPAYILSSGSHSVTVGAGGAAGNHSTRGNNGSSSVFGSLTANGGGYGGGTTSVFLGNGGGCGGGTGGTASGSIPGGGGTQGGDGGAGISSPQNGGGGGGADGDGQDGHAGGGGDGGPGTPSTITGSTVYYAGGGGGSTGAVGTAGTGGIGGGGAGNGASNSTGTSGTANTGGGGGAAHSDGTGGTGGAGGSGVVIISYPIASFTHTGGDVTGLDDDYRWVQFNSSGTLILADVITINVFDGITVSESRAVSVAHSNLRLGLVSYWKLDESGGTRADSHGSNPLTDNNGVASFAGKIGNAADFLDLGLDYLSHTSNSDLQTGDIDFTFSAWVSFVTVSGTRALITKDASGSREYSIDWTSNNLRFYIGDGSTGTVSHSFTPSIFTFYFVVCWHDAAANTLNIQINNGTPASASTSGAPPTGSAEFRLAARATSGSENYFDGQMDEVGFWKRTLTTSERTFLYNAGFGKTYPFVPGAKVMVVAGGGGAGSYRGGGGGAGGMLLSGDYPASGGSLTFTPYTVTVGAGGMGSGVVGGAGTGGQTSGGNSVFGTLTAHGGGYGGDFYGGINGANGGCGGGGGGAISPGTGGTGSQGTNGGAGYGSGDRPGGGGGGIAESGQAGNDPGGAAKGGDGGDGTPVSYTGSTVYYCGGGGGGLTIAGGTPGLGGIGGGGDACGGTNCTGESGTPNTGGGGGAATDLSGIGGSGGSGVVVIAYQTAGYTHTGGDVVTTDGIYTVVQFNSSGTFTLSEEEESVAPGINDGMTITDVVSPNLLIMPRTHG